MMRRSEGFMGKLSERELKALIKGGETNTVELKVAAPRATEMAKRLCGMANAQDGTVPTNAGLLFFGHHPQEHIVQGDVACVLFRETVGASRYADRRIVTGTLQELIDGAELFLSRYIAVGARVEGFKRIDIPEYSLEVLREAVINAVVHRDYSKH